MADVVFPRRSMNLKLIAKAMFATDERVKKFVTRRSEGVAAKREDLLRAAWDNDEQGWRSEIVKRVLEMDQYVLEATNSKKPTS